MKAKDIKIGELYRVANDIRGNGFWKAEVTGFYKESKWDRTTMSYTDIIKGVTIKATSQTPQWRWGHGVTEMPFNKVIQPWSEFVARFPAEAQKYEFETAHRQWDADRAQFLKDQFPESAKEAGASISIYGHSNRVSLNLTFEQYLTWAKSSPAKLLKAIGPEPVLEDFKVTADQQTLETDEVV